MQTTKSATRAGKPAKDPFTRDQKLDAIASIVAREALAELRMARDIPWSEEPEAVATRIGKRVSHALRQAFPL